MTKLDTIDRNAYNKKGYKAGPLWKVLLWYIFNLVFFANPFFPFRKIKPLLLRLFGAKVGKSCIIKPGVNIKHPWFLTLGDYVTIGENVWIDNVWHMHLDDVVTVSQGAIFVAGNHDYKSRNFDLMLKPTYVGKGAWICCKAIVGPGITIGKNAILSVGAVATKDLEEDGIYVGNPAKWVKKRIFYDQQS